MRPRIISLVLATPVLTVAVCGGCKRSTAPPNQTPATTADTGPQRVAQPQEGAPMTISSSAFGPGEVIPRRFTGDGDDVSPPLTWTGVPERAKELALICDDPDAPRPEPWVHWVIYKLPATLTGLPEHVFTEQRPAEPAGALQGTNSWNRIGYGGPAPPPGHGVHHYHFRLYALDAPLDAEPGLDKAGLLAAMKGHLVAEAELVGTYQR